MFEEGEEGLEGVEYMDGDEGLYACSSCCRRACANAMN